MKRRGWGGLAVGLLASSAAAAVGPEAYGRIVSRVDFECATPIDRRELAEVVALRSGEELTSQALETSLEHLRGKEIFAAIDIDAVETGEGTLVRFRLTPVDVIVGVAVAGARAIKESDVIRRARLREDEPLAEAGRAAAAERVRQLYADRGYPDARVEASVRTVEAARVRVRLEITEGEPLRIGALAVDGLDAELRSGALEALPFAVDGVFAKSSLADGRAALLKFLRGRGFYEAEATGEAPTVAGRISVRYVALTGPRYEIEVSGNPSLSTERLLGLIDLSARPVITAGTWRQMAQRMMEHYRDNGYAFVTVSASVIEGNPKRVRFEVQEGERVRVGSVAFAGNHALSTERLRRVMETRPRSRFAVGFPARFYREETLQTDLEAIHEVYRAEGYLEAEVPEVKHEYDERRTTVSLTLEIREGDRSVVAAVAVEGVDGLLDDPTRGLALRPGVPYRPEALDADRKVLQLRLAALGYAEAQVDGEGAPGEAAAGTRPVTVRFRITAGEEVRVGRIVVQRNYSTLDRVVRRELELHSGDPYDPAKLAAAQARIYRLGIFRSVSVLPLSERGVTRDVAVRVGERPEGELQYGFGYNTALGLRGFVQLADRNLFGTGRQASLRSDLNLSPDRFLLDEYIFSLDGKEPHAFRSDFDLRGNVTYQRSEREVDEFSIRRFDFSTGVERELARQLRASFMIEYEDSDIFDVAPDAVLTGKDVGKLRTVTLNPTLVYDGRNDPFAPKQGVFESARLRYGTSALGSDVDFLKVVLQHSHYVPLGAQLTWVYAVRLGVAVPFGSGSTIPLRERFFLGGRTTVRGFEENAVGPHGSDGNPSGGDLLVNLNTELRFPLFYGLGGAVFVDGGGLYLREESVSLGEFREAAGPGLRYQTPVGAISLDYGFKLDRRSRESIGEVHFTIGNFF